MDMINQDEASETNNFIISKNFFCADYETIQNVLTSRAFLHLGDDWDIWASLAHAGCWRLSRGEILPARRKPRTWQNLMVRMTNLPAGRAAVAVSRLSSPGLTKTKWGECENCRERREFETRQKLATNWFSASSRPAVRSFVVKMRTHHAGSK